MMKIFETHAHYDDEAFREDREALLMKCLQTILIRLSMSAPALRAVNSP